MRDRVPTKPGRVLITPENGRAPYYVIITRADEPTQIGMPLNKTTLLSDETVAMFGMTSDAVPDDVFRMLLPSGSRQGKSTYDLLMSGRFWQ